MLNRYNRNTETGPPLENNFVPTCCQMAQYLGPTLSRSQQGETLHLKKNVYNEEIV